MNLYILAIESLLVAAVSFGISFLKEKKKFFDKLPEWLEQTLIGLLFAGLAIFLDKFGYLDNNIVNENIRDSAPICAGLFFGLPSGIISGVIAGLYRFFSVYWGGVASTQLACSIATVLSGVLSGLGRKFMFKNHNPGIVLSLWIAIGCETIDLLLIFLTNMDNLILAYRIIDAASFVQIGFNALAVLISDLVVERKKPNFKPPYKLRPSFLNALNVSIICLVCLTGTMTFFINSGVAESQTNTNLTYNIDNVMKLIKENDGLNDSIKTWSVGEFGGIIVYKDSTLISCSQNNTALDLRSIDFKITSGDNEAYKLMKGMLNDEKVYTAYYSEAGYTVYAYITEEGTYLTRNTTLYTTLFIEILIYITMLCMVYQSVERQMIKPIHRFNDELKKITKGELNTTIDIHNSIEFQELSRDLNTTVNSLKTLISEAEHRNEKELELAKEIQMSAVPSSFPAFPSRKEIDIYALMNTAKEVGGDFYDFYFIDDTHLAILIADVSGKGIPAAMFMMSSKTLIKSLAESGKNVDEIFKEANTRLCEHNDAEMFLTAWMGIIDLETGILSFVSAGHNPPLIYRKTQEFVYIKEKPNFIMAGMPNSKYIKHEYQLNPDDKLYLYTDGVTEAENSQQKLYGNENLLKALNKNKELSVTDIANNVLKDVKDFTHDTPQSDDITMVSFELKYLNSSNSITIYPDQSSLGIITDFVDKKLAKLNISQTLRNKVEIAVDEIFSNIQKYGEATLATISFSFEEDKLVVSFIDNGYKFDPLKKEDPNISLKASERKIGGLGIFLVKKLSSSISYKYKDNLNYLYIEFNLKNKDKKLDQ